MRLKKLPVVTKKVVAVALMVGLALCTIVFAAGYWAFSKQFETQYDSSIRSIASAARECLHPDDFARYLETGEKDSAYMQTFAILQDFVDKFDLNLLYVSKAEPPDYTRITYIYNPVRKGGRWSEYPLGYFETYVEPEYNSSAKRVFEQGEVIVRHTEKTRSGSHITAMYPVMNSAGEVIAVIGVQKNIQEFVSARFSFVNFVVTTEIIFALLLVLLFSSFFNKKVIDPIMLVTQEASQFVSRGGEPSDKLLSLKNKDELRTLAESVFRMETDIKKHIEDLSRVTAEKERFETELGIASRIQVAMLPKITFPDRMDFDLFATMTPAKEVGGDLYDYFLIDDDHLLLVVGDVSGKGIPAALFMVVVKTLIHSYAEQQMSPSAIFETTNDLICRGNSLGYFITCWLGIMTLSTGEMKFVNAGHNHPVLLHDGGAEFLKTKPNFVLGGMDHQKYQEHTVTLAAGDALFLYTDGVTEANNAQRELFGDKRLMQAIDACTGENPEKVCKNVMDGLNTFVGNTPQFDDITMLSFRYNGKEGTLNRNTRESLEKTMEARPENQVAFSSFVEEALDKHQCPRKAKMQILVALDEIYSNIMKFSGADQVTIAMDINDGTFMAKITFIDNGTPYDPLKAADPDVTLPAEDRDAGGLGIFIVKKTMDGVSYDRKNNCNVFTIEKKLDA